MQKKQTSITQYVRDNKHQIEKYAIREYNKSEFFNSITIAVQESTDLQKCMQTPEGQNSMFHAIKLAAHTGLSLNPQKGEAALVAFKGRVSYLTMKNGLIKLATDSGKVDFITSDLVRKNDDFSVGKSFNGDTYTHRPALTDRGPVIGYYAGIKMKDGSTHVKYMTTDEVREHGKKYSAFFGSQNGPWQKSFDGMAIKTVLKSLFRNLHISDDTAVAVISDDEQEAIDAGAATIENSKGADPDDLKAMMDNDDQPEFEEPEQEETQGDSDRIF
jgi:recombination protein RecT